jgi:hypothetical protein
LRVRFRNTDLEGEFRADLRITMKKVAPLLFCFIVFSILSVSTQTPLPFILEPSTAMAASAQEALTALKKLQSRCEIGISYRDYSGALADANYEVKEYKNSDAARQNQELKYIIAMALGDYIIAENIWEIKVGARKHFVEPNDELWQLFLKIYPDAIYLMKTEYSDILKKSTQSAYLEEMLSYAWGEAGKKIQKANALMAAGPSKKSKKK